MKYKKVCKTCFDVFITFNHDFLLCYPCWKKENVRRERAEREIIEKSNISARLEKGFLVSMDEFVEYEKWKMKKQFQYHLDRDEL